MQIESIVSNSNRGVRVYVTNSVILNIKKRIDNPSVKQKEQKWIHHRKNKTLLPQKRIKISILRRNLSKNINQNHILTCREISYNDFFGPQEKNIELKKCVIGDYIQCRPTKPKFQVIIEKFSLINHFLGEPLYYDLIAAINSQYAKVR